MLLKWKNSIQWLRFSSLFPKSTRNAQTWYWRIFSGLSRVNTRSHREEMARNWPAWSLLKVFFYCSQILVYIWCFGIANNRALQIKWGSFNKIDFIFLTFLCDKTELNFFCSPARIQKIFGVYAKKSWKKPSFQKIERFFGSNWNFLDVTVQFFSLSCFLIQKSRIYSNVLVGTSRFVIPTLLKFQEKHLTIMFLRLKGPFFPKLQAFFYGHKNNWEPFKWEALLFYKCFKLFLCVRVLIFWTWWKLLVIAIHLDSQIHFLPVFWSESAYFFLENFNKEILVVDLRVWVLIVSECQAELLSKLT